MRFYTSRIIICVLSLIILDDTRCMGCWIKNINQITCQCHAGVSVLCDFVKSTPWVDETACAEYCGVSVGEECNFELCLPSDAAPKAMPRISGTMAVGQTLTGSYTYSDAENDPEGTSTFQWYTGFFNGFIVECNAAISGATSDTYTIQAGDAGKYICFGVTPVATSGTSPGTEAVVKAFPAVPENSAPTATGVSISGTPALGQMLTGSYTYSDAESDPEGTSTFQWYTGTDANCADKTAISGSTSNTYTIQASDVNKFICFGVTPVAASGTSPGTEAVAATAAAVPANAAPTATGVSITGTAAAGQTLTGTYTYADADNDEQGTSTFRWYSGTDDACAGKTEVGTAVTYTAADADKDKYLCFEVTPAAKTGTTPGTAVMSAGVKVTAAATAPGYGSAPAPGSIIDVGTAAVGSPVSTALQVSETGNATLNVAGHALGGANPGDFSVTPATLTLADGGAAQNLTVQCTPAAAGLRTATLTVNHNAPGSPATYTLNCTGKLPGDVDGNGKIELADAVLALKISAGVTLPETQTVNFNADADGDGKIGMAEVVYILAYLR